MRDCVASAKRRTYDHRIREAIVSSGDATLFSELSIPRSTKHTWLRRGAPRVVIANNIDQPDLRLQLARMSRQIEVLRAVIRLLLALVRATNIRLASERVPTAEAKMLILRTIERASPTIGRKASLRILGLRPGRIRQWQRAATKCELEDAPPCPRSFPTRLTFEERAAMRDMVEDDALKHLSVRSLALLGQRLGRVFASYETWCRAIRRFGWHRQRHRIYPATPKRGLRAERPGQWIHIDVTIIRLLGGTRAYLHAVVDNFSRRILSWSLEQRLSARTTRRLLHEALTDWPQATLFVNVVTDGGSENSGLGEQTGINHVVAQIDIAQSNSLVEALWSQLKNRWLFTHTLNTFSGLQRLIEVYFRDHNQMIPRAELKGRTPDEAFRGLETDLPQKLREQHTIAAAQRIVSNRARKCERCRVQSTASVM